MSKGTFRRSKWRVQTLSAKNVVDELEVGIVGSLDWHVQSDDFDDFYRGPSTQAGAPVTDSDLYDASGAAGTIADGATTEALHGAVKITTGATANNDIYLWTLKQTVKFIAGKKASFKARVKVTEGNTDDAIVVVGLSDTTAADFMLDTTGGPAASYDGAVFYKVSSSSAWQAETSESTNQATDTNAGTLVSATWQTLELHWDGKGFVTFYVDGKEGARLAIATASALEEMNVIMGLKAGSNNAEVMLVDYWEVAQER